MAYEFPEGYDPSDKKSQADAYAHLFNERFLPAQGCAIEIQSLRNEAEALWGPEIVPKLDELLRLARSLQVAMAAYVSDKKDYGSHFANNQKFGADIGAKVFDAGNTINPDGMEGAPNALTMQIGSAVEQVSIYLKTKLPRPSPKERLINPSFHALRVATSITQ